MQMDLLQSNIVRLQSEKNAMADFFRLTGIAQTNRHLCPPAHDLEIELAHELS